MGNVHSAQKGESALRKKGFQRLADGDHIHFIFFNKNEEAVVRTKISHGPKGRTLSVKLISEMAKQCQLTKQQYLDFVECRLSEDEHREILREKGFDV